MNEIQRAREKIIIALDVPDRKTAEATLDRLGEKAPWIKIGLQLFIAEGPDIIQIVRERGHKIFLDLKLHDIPVTVAKAVASICNLGVEMTTLHTLGGPNMLAEAAKAATGSQTTLLGVTILTSMDTAQLAAIKIPNPPSEQVLFLAQLAKDAGIPGLVASPQEIALLRKKIGPKMRLVIPGIRPQNTAHGDQKRVMPPGTAIQAGADWLVIGRPILEAENPQAALEAVVNEIAETLPANPACLRRLT
ncbi:MAG: orotidine-5'-phosphate decarboxylase [Chthoniobacterales bacterium]